MKPIRSINCEVFLMVAQAVAAPLANVDSITMYGSGNTAKLTEDVTTSLKQIMDGVGDSLGINPSVLLSSFVGTKLAGLTDKEDAKKDTTVVNVVASGAQSEKSVDVDETTQQ